MSFIFLTLTALLLLVNLGGIALLLRPWLPHHLLAKAAGLIGFVLLLFFVEHFIGLGRLIWLWPISTLISLAMLRHWRAELKGGLWKEELVFLLAFCYALFWKFSFPDIDYHSEQLTDLSFINSYLPGATLPPADSWLPALRFNVYYAFQHYGAALLARILGLEAGYAMNLAIAVTLALLASLAWFVANRFVAGRRLKVVLVAAIMVGGSGIAPLTHFIIEQHPVTHGEKAFAAVNNLWTSVRFAGAYEDRVNTKLGQTLFPKLSPVNRPNPDFEQRDLPLETIGYLTYAGDFHPPLGGFVLLFLALGCITVLETTPRPTVGKAEPPTGQPHTFRYLQIALAATVPLTLITNAWVFPLQLFLLLAWVIYRHGHNNPPDWPALLTGGVSAFALIYPVFGQFAGQSLEIPIKLVESLDRTPLNLFIGIHWPALVLMGLTLTQVRRNRFALLLVMTFALLLLMSEVIYIDDQLGGKFNRFNTTLKWWSWIYPAILLTLGSICLGAGKWLRWVALVVLLLVASYGIDMAAYWGYSQKTSMGKLAGNQWLRQDQVDKQLLEFLKVSPRGVVLESLDAGGAYTPSSAFALFSGQPSANGWPAHVAQWRGNPGYISANADKNRVFYRGELPDALSWLTLNDVRYIIWNRRDHQRMADARDRINGQIGSRYIWKPFWQNGAEELGCWFRK
ncbi:hypothetical protein D4S03_05950 [bacterium]|nr:MAG: hypothetical protein D4S03_05950 [bacterium]